jgi:preprotein translocase subunit YajC
MNQLFASLPTLMAAPSGEAGGGSVVVTIITFGLIFVIFYFLIIRPQNKQKKETQKMIDAVKKGDRIVTIGGIHGTVQSVKESEVVIKVDSNSKMTMSRNAISSVTANTRPTRKAEAEVETDVDVEAESEETTEDDS